MSDNPGIVTKADQAMNIHAKLAYIQANLRVNKNRGKGHDANAGVSYEFRNAEDILEAVKQYTPDLNCRVDVTVVPEVIGPSVPVEIRVVGKDRYGADIFAMISGPRFAAVATAIFTDNATGDTIERKSFAFIDAWRKGQTEPEKLCGSADSYASKYALMHLLALDNNRDADMESNERPQQTQQPIPNKPNSQPKAPADGMAF